MKTSFLMPILAIASSLPLSAQPAFAEDLVMLKGDVKVVRTVVEEGKERSMLAAPTDVVPGDKLVFATEYHNTGAKAVENFVVTNPLPAAVRLADTSGGFDVSVDGGKIYGNLASLTVSDDVGSARPAQYSDVTHIRWTLARLAPGERGTLTYTAFVR
ncbi:MAG: hypothetical protein R3D89_02135 [Sphingomonadaceae bacterium]